MAKKPELDDFRVPFFDGGKKLKPFDLKSVDSSAKPFSRGSKEEDRERFVGGRRALDELQEKLHAQHRQRVLLVLQGMDTSGKDGTIRARVSRSRSARLAHRAVQGAFRAEAAHDFLWRVHSQAPMAGELCVFNRSHYEDVLVPRVLKLIDDDECERRYRHIREFEALLADSGTTIVKCFLHISKDEQRQRLQARIDDPTKHWKFDSSDLEARKQWDDYQKAYADGARRDID